MAQGLQPIWAPRPTPTPQQQQQQQQWAGRLQLRHAPTGAPPPPLDDSQEAGPEGGSVLRPHVPPRVQRAVVDSSDEEEPAGHAGLPQQQREQGSGLRRAARRFLDDGGHGRGSDAEEGSSPDSFINDGPSSSDDGASSSSEDDADNERRPLAERLATGRGGTGCKRRRTCPSGSREPGEAGLVAVSPSVVCLLSESEAQELPPLLPGPEKHAAGAAAGQQQELASGAQQQQQQQQVNQQQEQQEQQAVQARPRRRRHNELVSLQPFYYDPHRDQHPASAQHFGLVEGRRPRRRPAAYMEEAEEGDDDLAAALAEIEAMEAKEAGRQAAPSQQQQQHKLPRRRATRAVVEAAPVEEVRASSGSDDDAPLVSPHIALRLRSGTPAALEPSTAAAANPAAGVRLHAGQQQRPKDTPHASPSPSWLPSISPVSPSQPAAAAGPTPLSVCPALLVAAEENAAVVPADQGQDEAAEQRYQQQPDPAVVPDSEDEE